MWCHKNRHNICCINPYKYDTNVEDITPEKYVMMSTYDHKLYTSILYIKSCTQGI